MKDPIVVVNPNIMSGEPCFRGTRVPFQALLNYLEHGRPLSEFLDDFPTVTESMAIQALEEAKESLFVRVS